MCVSIIQLYVLKNYFIFLPEKNFCFTTVPRKFGFSEKGSTDIKSPKTRALDDS